MMKDSVHSILRFRTGYCFPSQSGQGLSTTTVQRDRQTYSIGSKTLCMSLSLHDIHGKRIPQSVSIANHDCWQFDSNHIPGISRTHHPVREKTYAFYILLH